jgi:hypothetical protein
MNRIGRRTIMCMALIATLRADLESARHLGNERGDQYQMNGEERTHGQICNGGDY